MIPANNALRGSYQRGYASRLAGVSRYSSPYTEGPGWGGAHYQAWQNGWNAADQATSDGFRIVLPADQIPEEEVTSE